MGRLKQRRVQQAEEEFDRKKVLKKASEGVQQGQFTSIRKAAEASNCVIETS